VPNDSDGRRELGAAQARAIRDLLEWLRDRRSPQPRVRPSGLDKWVIGGVPCAGVTPRFGDLLGESWHRTVSQSERAERQAGAGITEHRFAAHITTGGSGRDGAPDSAISRDDLHA
jgi:hypothetical protein